MGNDVKEKRLWEGYGSINMRKYHMLVIYTTKYHMIVIHTTKYRMLVIYTRKYHTMVTYISNIYVSNVCQKNIA